MVKKIKIKKYIYIYISILEFLLRKAEKAKSMLSWVASSTVSNKLSSLLSLQSCLSLKQAEAGRVSEKNPENSIKHVT